VSPSKAAAVARCFAKSGRVGDVLPDR
jgi:hypothetical protein